MKGHALCIQDDSGLPISSANFTPSQQQPVGFDLSLQHDCILNIGCQNHCVMCRVMTATSEIETSHLMVKAAAQVGGCMLVTMFAPSRNMVCVIHGSTLFCVQMAQLCMDNTTWLVAFHFAMAYHELTVAMVVQALHTWPIAHTLSMLQRFTPAQWTSSWLCQHT